jgi:tetratricopeptide (TPR) repeat protein
MNNIYESSSVDGAPRSALIGKFPDLPNIIKVAANGLGKGKYSLAIDYCRKVVKSAGDRHSKALIAEAYYIWCLSCLKLDRPNDARKVCYEARLRLGNYLDLVYFELLIEATSGEVNKIPRYVDNYLQLHDAAGGGLGSAGEHSRDKIGEVLLIGGRAYERLENMAGALEIYKKYISLYPDDKPMAERIRQLTVQLNCAREKAVITDNKTE